MVLPVDDLNISYVQGTVLGSVATVEKRRQVAYPQVCSMWSGRQKKYETLTIQIVPGNKGAEWGQS